MALVNRALPALIGGVSQQPDASRHATQVDACENMLPSVATGLRTRPGARHWGLLATGEDYSDAFVHWFENEQGEYALVINVEGNLKVFDSTGVEIPVTFPDGIEYLGGSELPRERLKAVTVADYTFVTNKAVVTAMGASDPDNIAFRAFVWVKTGVIQTSYTVTVDGTAKTYTTGDATDANGTNTAHIASQLAADLSTIPGITASANGSQIVILKSGDAEFSFSCSDSWGNQAMFMFSDEVNRYEDLPRTFYPARIIKVNGDPNNANSAWYVKWKQDDANSDGVWIETRAPDLDNEISHATMPHQLRQETDGTFVFEEAVWDDRLVGDENSNPIPSFIGHGINDVFFHRNRLGFLADENLILSQAGSYFNFWNTTARAVVDSDPIDVSASTNQVAILNHVVPFDKSLMIFSDRQQFMFEGGETLSPRTARVVPATSFASFGPPPTVLGRNVFFSTHRGDHTSIREYYYDGNTVTNDAVDTTSHVPSYIPVDVSRLTSCAAEDMLFVQQVDERNVLYVYNSYWNGDEKIQSAWHLWRFDAGDNIVSVNARGSRLSLIIQRTDGLYLEYLEVSAQPYTPTSYEIKLDRWVTFASGLYDSTQRKTFWTLPYTIPDGAEVRVITTQRTGDLGQGLIAEQVGPATVCVRGDYTLTEVVVGITYDSWFRFSQQYPVDGKGQILANARVQIRDMTVQYVDTGYFTATVAADGREERSYVYSGTNLGLVRALIGSATIEDGHYKIPILCRNTDVEIEIHNDSHLPARFIAAEWQGHITMQARRG